MKFAVTDIETTGATNKITEIAIYVFDDEKMEVIDSFHSMVNPESHIPEFIVKLTGITNEMVADAPCFYEIAKEVHAITENRIFVAHNVNFDYNVIKSEFAYIGGEFKQKRLCTVRLSRKAFPGYPSYSLGKLCKSMGIPLTDRHRATGDAKATTLLLKRVFEESKQELIIAFLNARSKEATLPPNLSKETYKKLPAKPGVYFLHGEDGKVIYVGKANSIKQRIDGHFSSSNAQKIKLKSQIFDISYTLTGNEFLALLVESVMIRKYFPPFNKAQKYSGNAYSICSYENQDGVIRMDIVKTKKGIRGNVISSFSNQVNARNFLQQMVSSHNLCPKMCGLHKVTTACLNEPVGLCFGVCAQKESAKEYNLRVQLALDDHLLECGDYLCLLPGRLRGEKSFVYVEKGIFKGYGFLDAEVQYTDTESILDQLIPQNHNAEIGHILRNNIHKLNETNLLEMKEV